MAVVSMTVNGKSVSAETEDRTLLVYFLREQLRLTGTHIGCDTSQCGACVVHVNGRAVKSCSLFAVQAEGVEYQRLTGLGGLVQVDGDGFAGALQHVGGLACQCGRIGAYLVPEVLLSRRQAAAGERQAESGFWETVSHKAVLNAEC